MNPGLERIRDHGASSASPSAMCLTEAHPVTIGVDGDAAS